MKFQSDRVGRRLRINARPYVLSRSDVIKGDWTPMRQGSVSIGLGRNGGIKCRRFQFPLVPACAITIHKSQGGTFDSVVMQYDKKQDQQLVYVAMSRATSVEGLHIVNKDKDHVFYHGRGNDSPSIREIRNEYVRLEQHPLRTITDRAETFFDVEEDGETKKVVVVSHNVQSSRPLQRHRDGRDHAKGRVSGTERDVDA